jgi:hypothetical protein
MMSKKLEIILWVFLGILLGAWMALNVHRGQPMFANPFTEPSGSAAMAEALQEAYRETQQGIAQDSAHDGK